MRRKGATQEEIEAELLEANMRRCRPRLDDGEVRKIAASVARYEIGGPDPLEAAWEVIRESVFTSRYEQFLALARQLQLARPSQTIALPVVRVAELLDCKPTLISRYRKRAQDQGFLKLVERHIPHRKATLFLFDLTVQVGRVELNHVSSGLVVHPSSSLVVLGAGKAPSYTPHIDSKETNSGSEMIEGRI